MAGPKIIDSFLHVIKDAAFSAAVKAEGMIKARGYDTTVPSLVQKFPVPAAAIGTTAQSITIAQILTGVLEEDPVGDAAWTFPIGSLLVAGVDGAAVGDCIDFCIINTDGTADIAIERAGDVYDLGMSAVGRAEKAAGMTKEAQEIAYNGVIDKFKRENK